MRAPFAATACALLALCLLASVHGDPVIAAATAEDPAPAVAAGVASVPSGAEPQAVVAAAVEAGPAVAAVEDPAARVPSKSRAAAAPVPSEPLAAAAEQATSAPVVPEATAAAAPVVAAADAVVTPADAVATPEAESTGAVTAQNTLITIPYNNQCGGRGSTTVNGWPGCGTAGRECRDSPWSGVVCAAGTACVRSNEWWWFCNWATQPPPPAVTPVNPWAQCGGASACGAPGRECRDAPWSGVACTTGHACTRSNEWWWMCSPTTTATVCRRAPSPAAPANSNWPATGCDNVAPGSVCTAPCGAGFSGTVTSTCGSNGVWGAASGSCTSGGGGGGSTGCPAGWLRAVGTLYDSWPKAGTTECIEYSGCRWAGLFSRLSAGPLFSAQPACNPSLCRTWTDWRGFTNRAQCLAGDQRSFEVACRWPEASVRSWKMAATWDRFPSGLLDRTVDVMVQGVPGRVATVRVMDVCNDSDCRDCCSRNTGNNAFPLIDLEKWAALDLLGNFDPNAANFDINNVVKPAACNLRPGAPSYVMPLCYRVLP